MNETILLELRLKVAEAQRDLAIAEKNLSVFLSSHSSHETKEISTKEGLLPSVLAELKKHELMATNIIAEKCNASPQTIRVILSRAKKRGLVESTKSNGFHESKIWRLTQKGALENIYTA